MHDFTDYAGYLYTSNDVLLNPYQLATYDQTKVRKQVPTWPKDVHDGPWPLHRATTGIGRCPARAMWDDPTSFTPEQRERIVQFTGVPGPVDVLAFCDAVYVPARISRELTSVLERFLAITSSWRWGVGLALVAIESPEEWVDWNKVYLRDQVAGYARATWHDSLEPGVDTLHPVKLGHDVEAKDIIKAWIESVQTLQ